MSRKPKIDPAEIDMDAAPGTVLAEGVIEGRPVVWKSPPIISKPGGPRRIAHWDRSYKRFTEYQQHVRAVAASARRRRRVYGGDVRLEVVIYTRREGRQAEGDLTNYVKALEDGIKGVVIRDDVQVVEQRNFKIRRADEPHRAEFRVVAVGAEKGGE